MGHSRPGRASSKSGYGGYAPKAEVHGISGCNYRLLRVDVSALGVIQAPEPDPRILRYELSEFEWAAIKPVLPNGAVRMIDTHGAL